MRDQLIKHPSAEALSACPRRYGDLPDEELAGSLGRTKPGNPTGKFEAAFGDNARLREVRALQEVAVRGIRVERRGGRNEPRDGGAVRGTRPAECDGAAADLEAVVRTMVQLLVSGFNTSNSELLYRADQGWLKEFYRNINKKWHDPRVRGSCFPRFIS